MKITTYLCLSFATGLLIPFRAVPAQAQTQFVRGDYFPAEYEFKELQKIRREVKFDGGAKLVDVPGSAVLEEVGFQHYAMRVYETVGGVDLSIEVVTASDDKAAFSLLTLLRDSGINQGPPGESYTLDGRQLTFAKAAFWVRIRGDNAADLLKRVAESVGNRIGQRDHIAPLLTSHLPQSGLDASSVRYFLGSKSFESYSSGLRVAPIEFHLEMEIAQANYSLQNQSGLLSLVSFPTAQMAGEYFDRLPENLKPSGSPDSRVFSKRVGPLVGILEGTFDAATADKILGNIKFSYSIKWIYDKNNRSSATVWGVPVGILGTVVRSLLLTMLLCGMSLLLGVGMAVFRVLLRDYAPGNFLDNPERTEMIRLRLNEPPPLDEPGGNTQSGLK